MNYLILFFLLFVSCNGSGGGQIEIKNAWIREVPPGSGITAAYFEIKNSGNSSDTVVSINSPISERAEIHNTVIDSNGNAKMEKIDKIPVAPKDSVKFSPGGLHVMLIGLNETPKEGEQYVINIEFKEKGSKKVNAEVRGLEHSMKGHMNH